MGFLLSLCQVCSFLLSSSCETNFKELGDSNLSRTAATNAVRRQVDCKIVLATSDRITTEEDVDRRIKESIKAHDAKNPILVLTKLDVS